MNIPSFKIVDLGELISPLWSSATNINNNLQVVGDVFNLSNESEGIDMWQSRRAALWQNGVCTKLDLPIGSSSCFPTAINDSGMVVGRCDLSVDRWQATIWRAGIPYILPNLGVVSSCATGINEKQQIVGFSASKPSLSSDRNVHRAVMWYGDKIVDLGTLGGWWSEAFGINNDGGIVGASELSPARNSVTQAFIWRRGNMSPLGTLGGDCSHARDINDVGWVTGSAQTEDGVWKAFLCRAGAMNALRTNEMNEESSALSLNIHGSIVGSITSNSGSTAACLWHGDELFMFSDIVLSSHGWDFYYGGCINDAGYIVGWGQHEGRQKSFLLAPIT